MSSRAGFTNAVIDAMLSRTQVADLWTRDVPNGFVANMFPYRMDKKSGEMGTGKLLITPAKESDRGRGQVFYDVHTTDLEGLEIGISLKISNFDGDDRAPRNSSVCGSKAEHLFGLILAARDEAILPVLQFWQDESGQWWRCCFNLSTVLNSHAVKLTEGWSKLLGGDFPNRAAEAQIRKLTNCLGYTPEIARKDEGGALAISPMVRGKGKYVYLNAKVSHYQTGHEWTAVDSPRMPTSYEELLDWMGELGDLIG
jgi:hypothetical protein